MGADMSEDYLRTIDEAMDAVAQILEMPSQRDRLIQSTVRIMMCVNPEPREFLSDSQALLIEGGLEAMAKKRHDLLEALEANTAVVILNPDEDGLYDAVGSSLDALRLSDLAFRVFPGLRVGYAPWQLARTLRRNQSRFEELVSQGIRRRGGDGYRKAQETLERLIREDGADLGPRLTLVQDACRKFFQASRASETPVSDTDALVSLFAVDDERAAELEGAMRERPDDAQDLLRRTFECLTSLRSLQEKAA
jgi:hypothetical protein